MGVVTTLKRMLPAPLEAALEPERTFRIEARVPRCDLTAGRRVVTHFRLEQLRIDEHPPASGPEVALWFDVKSRVREHAEHVATRELEGLGYNVLALAVRP